MLSAIGLVFTLWTNRSIARKRATLDLLLMMQTNRDFLEERRLFIKTRSAGRLLDWVDDSKADSPERRAIRAVLNMFEFVAIGINENTIDGDIFRRSYRTAFVQDWIDLKAFVMEVRRFTKTPTFYCEYEALAKNWATKLERPHM